MEYNKGKENKNLENCHEQFFSGYISLGRENKSNKQVGLYQTEVLLISEENYQ